MKFYGRKGSAFGQAYKRPDKKRQHDWYDSLVRAGRKRERQAAKKECLAGIDDYEYSILDYWLWYDGDDYDYEEEWWYDECY